MKRVRLNLSSVDRFDICPPVDYYSFRFTSKLIWTEFYWHCRDGRFGIGPRGNNEDSPPGRSADVLLAMCHGGELPGFWGVRIAETESRLVASGDAPLAAFHIERPQCWKWSFQAIYSETSLGMACMSHVSFYFLSITPTTFPSTIPNFSPSILWIQSNLYTNLRHQVPQRSKTILPTKFMIHGIHRVICYYAILPPHSEALGWATLWWRTSWQIDP